MTHPDDWQPLPNSFPTKAAPSANVTGRASFHDSYDSIAMKNYADELFQTRGRRRGFPQKSGLLRRITATHTEEEPRRCDIFEPTRSAENAAENRIHVLRVIAQVEQCANFRFGKRGANLLVREELRQEVGAAVPDLGSVPLDEGVGGLAR
jgi:hypothetical protein